MEMKKRNTNSLNETLKKREAAERERLMNEVQDGEEKVMALDDTQRVKVLSPGRLVMKRFFRNKLAIIGLAVLIFMFVFAFICPLFYPYSQTQIFTSTANWSLTTPARRSARNPRSMTRTPGSTSIIPF